MEDSKPLANRRRLKRYRLYTDIKVVDSLRGKHIGKLIDIHQEGLLILGPTMEQLGSSYQIKLLLPDSVNLQQQFELGIECLWCLPSDGDDGLFWTGCGIIDKSDVATACIASLINIRSQ